MNEGRIKRVDSKKGQSLVEFALSLFFILLLVTGIVDLGRAFFTYMDLREAAQEGAAYGSIYPGYPGLIRARVKESSNTIEDSPIDLVDDIDLVYSGGSCAEKDINLPGNDISVTVQYPGFPITMPFLGTIIGTQAITITATASDRIITPLCP